MARTRTSRTDDLDFGENPSAPPLPGNNSVQQPAPPSAAASVEDPIGLIARSLGVDRSQLSSLGDALEKAKLLAVAGEVKDHAQRIRSEEEQKHLMAWNGKSAAERTQIVADRAWGSDPDVSRWRVFQATNPDAAGKADPFPLDIPARSPEEAQARYLQVCGIRSTEHHVRVVPMEEVLRRRAEKAAMRDIAEGFGD